MGQYNGISIDTTFEGAAFHKVTLETVKRFEITLEPRPPDLRSIGERGENRGLIGLEIYRGNFAIKRTQDEVGDERGMHCMDLRVRRLG